MKKEDILKAEKIVILGLGMEGRATLEWLLKNGYKREIIVADEGNLESQKSKVKSQKFFGGDDFWEVINEVDEKTIVVRSAGFPLSKPILSEMKKKGARITTATNIFFSNFNGRIIGVTGSKGKSTTASLIYTILEKGGLDVELAGNIGRPVLELIDSDVSWVVMELSSYQLADLESGPEIAVITSLFPEHLDWHGGEDNYYDAKKNILRAAKRVFCTPQVNSKFKIQNAKIPDKEDFTTKLKGEHNQMNIGLASAVARELGVSDDTIKVAIAEFEPLKHRLEIVGDYAGITWIDDAISTTPDSTLAAMEAFSGRRIDTLFLGGTDRGLDFSSLAQKIVEQKILHVVLFPDSGARIWKAIVSVGGFQPEKLETRSMAEAVSWSAERAQKGSVVLLSCASPSYSLWKNFEEKGNEFQKWVRKVGI